MTSLPLSRVVELRPEPEPPRWNFYWAAPVALAFAFTPLFF